ncbi:hypothetical protein OAO01_09180 [Oligoflexia bacterium]|nr:hypothetical protein [Oligoflexia bacterium]
MIRHSDKRAQRTKSHTGASMLEMAILLMLLLGIFIMAGKVWEKSSKKGSDRAVTAVNDVPCPPQLTAIPGACN